MLEMREKWKMSPLLPSYQYSKSWKLPVDDIQHFLPQINGLINAMLSVQSQGEDQKGCSFHP